MMITEELDPEDYEVLARIYKERYQETHFVEHFRIYVSLEDFARKIRKQKENVNTTIEDGNLIMERDGIKRCAPITNLLKLGGPWKKEYMAEIVADITNDTQVVEVYGVIKFLPSERLIGKDVIERLLCS